VAHPAWSKELFWVTSDMNGYMQVMAMAPYLIVALQEAMQ